MHRTKIATSSSATGITALASSGLYIATVTKAFIWKAICDNVESSAWAAAAVAHFCPGGKPIYFAVGYDALLGQKVTDHDRTLTKEEYFLTKGLQMSPAMLALASNPDGQVTAFAIQHNIDHRCRGNSLERVLVTPMNAYQTRRGKDGALELIYAEIPESYTP